MPFDVTRWCRIIHEQTPVYLRPDGPLVPKFFAAVEPDQAQGRCGPAFHGVLYLGPTRLEPAVQLVPAVQPM